MIGSLNTMLPGNIPYTPYIPRERGEKVLPITKKEVHIVQLNRKIENNADKNKSNFFCICDQCGAIEWIESYEMSEEDNIRINGLIASGMQRFDTIVNPDKFNDLLCYSCENTVIPIMFADVPLEKRKEIYNQKGEERIKFIENYKLLKNLEGENETNDAQ